jgi:hypothetical protein
MPPHPTEVPEPRESLSEFLAAVAQQTASRAASVWQDRLERLRAVADEGRGEIERVVLEQVAAISAAVQARVAEEKLEIVTALMRSLGDAFARMRRYESDWQWCEALLDGAATISRRAAFFSVRGRMLCFQGARGLAAQSGAAPVETPLESAPSFYTVWRTAAPLEAAPDASHLSKPIANLFGDAGERRALLIPVMAAECPAGVLYVEGALDRTAAEAVASFAGATLQSHLGEQLVRPPATVPPDLRDAATLGAQRFARVQTARILLEHGDAVRNGRESRNVYAVLKSEIDAARLAYREKYPGVADYLHAEMVRTLAQDDPSVLGRLYPGPLS